MEQIIEILKRLHPTVDVEQQTALVDDGVLDSLDMVTLITELNRVFDISIPASEILPDNFNSVAAINAMIRRLCDV